MPDSPKNPKNPRFGDFLDNVQDYYKAIESEFEVITGDSPESQEAQIECIKKVFRPKLPTLARNMLNIAEQGDTDNVRLNATKSIFAFMFGSANPESTKDDMASLLKELAKNDPS